MGRIKKTIDLEEKKSSQLDMNINEEQKIDVIDVQDTSTSPLLEEMIERKTNESFLNGGGNEEVYKDNSTQSTAENTESKKTESQNTSTNIGGNINNPPPTGPKEFTLDDFDNTGQPSLDGSQPTSSEKIENNSISPEISDGGAELMADTLLEGFSLLAPDVIHSYSKINEGLIRKFENDDKIRQGTTDVVKEKNKENRKEIKVTSEHKKMIRTPLVKVLTIQNVKASPESMLVIAILVVCISLFIQARNIKSSNDDLVKSLLRDHDEMKQLKERAENAEKENEKLRNKGKEIPFVEAEVV
jgi:hypothetical protein